MSKQTMITIETESLLILRSRNSRREWCPRCTAEAEMIALENTGATSNPQKTALEACLNSADLHLVQASDGSTLICLNSLLARVRSTKTP